MKQVQFRHAVVTMALLLAVLPRGALAQQRDTTKTREELIRERLRRLGPLVKKDTAQSDSSAARDTLMRPPPQIRPRPDLMRQQQPVEGLTNLPRDSTMLALLQLSGYVSTEYRGDSATYRTDSSRLELRGKAEVVQQGQRITADTSLVYWEKLALVCAHGSPVVSGAGVDAPIRSDSLCYNVSTNRGMAHGAKTEITQGATWYVDGRGLMTVDGVVYSHDAIFTDCTEDHPHYHFAAEHIKVINNNILIARSVTLNFGGVPVFWLPFFVQSLSQGRRSGLLFPRFGINDIARNSSNYNRRIEDVGFYWAISDHLGAEMALDWQSNNYTSLRGSFDYRYLRSFFDGAMTFRRFWRSEGGTEFTLASVNSWQPDERTRLSMNANYASSSAFVRTQTFNPFELNRAIESDVSVNRRFDWGNLSAGARRKQFLSDNSVQSTLPSVNLSISSITLFPALPGQGGPFNNATWTASANGRREINQIDDVEAALNLQSQSNFTGGASSTFTVGRFSLGQSITLNERIFEPRDFEADTIMDLGRRIDRNADWNTSLSYQQRLIGTSTLTPGLRLGGRFARDTLDGSMVAGPTRLDFNASLATDLFGFFPGLGPFEAIRHRFSPSFSWSYSPAPTVTDLQRRVFQIDTSSVRSLREQNVLTIGLTQSFEAKFKPGRAPRQFTPERPKTLLDSLAALPPEQRAELADSLRLRADSAARAIADSLLMARDTTGPRRRETGQKITLLSLSTSALVYDFVQEKEKGEGFQTLTIGNNIQSDLLRGLQLSITHDLFRRMPLTPADPMNPAPGPVETRREFAPHLSQINASFSLNSDSWFARLLRLSPRSGARVDSVPRQPESQPGAGPAIDRTRAEQGLIGSGRREQISAPTSPVGTWSASLTYSLSRPRAEEQFATENQMVSGNISFQPTENWSMQWNTGYSLSRGEFTDHALTFTRRLHDFDANFDFFKAQNGNFSFQFRVHLRANPDLKLDYEQRDISTTGGLIR